MKKFLVVFLIALIGTTCVFAQEASTVTTASDDLFALVDGTEVTALEAVNVEGGIKDKKELGGGGPGSGGITSGSIPAKVKGVLETVRTTGEAPEGYVGGSTYKNVSTPQLPKTKPTGESISYKEWDVNPQSKTTPKLRGVERLITGNDNSAWYTPDHYKNFVEIK